MCVLFQEITIEYSERMAIWDWHLDRLFSIVLELACGWLTLQGI